MMPSSSGVQSVEALFLLLLLFVALFAGLARRPRVPYPILLARVSCTESGQNGGSVCFIPRSGLWTRSLFAPPWAKSMPFLAR
jgi:hypothetical protein